MSRTKGPQSAERHEHDEYITPAWCIERFLERYSFPTGTKYILDPFASRGELLVTVQRILPDVTVSGIEINPTCELGLSCAIGSHSLWIGDFLIDNGRLQTPERPNPELGILSNPPYIKAQEGVERSLQFAQTVAMLLRLNFLAAKERREFTARTNPGIFVLPNRPSFDGWGSDGCEYAWFVYGDPRVAGTWQVLDLTPTEVIEAHNAMMRLRYPEVGERKKAERLAKKAAKAVLAEAA